METFSTLLLLGICIVMVVAEHHTDTGYMKISAFKTQREKRTVAFLAHLGAAALEGLAAKRKLLKGLKPSGRSDKVVLYFKKGGQAQMIEDFQSVNPSNIGNHQIKLLGPGLRGMVGDRLIYVGTGNDGTSRLLFIKRTLDGDPSQNVIGITYTDKK